MIAMLTAMARVLRRTDDSIATPCSENAYGLVRRPPQLSTPAELEVTNWGWVKNFC